MKRFWDTAQAGVLTYWQTHWKLCTGLALLIVVVDSGMLHLLDGWKEAVHSLMVWGGWPVFYLFTLLYNVAFVPFPYDPFLLAAPWLIPGHSVSFVWLVATLALTTSAGVDVWLGKTLAHRIRPWLVHQKGYHRCEKALHKYGVWAVGLSAVTPIPFSLVCWVAGILDLSLTWTLGVTFVSRGIRCALVLLIWGS